MFICERECMYICVCMRICKCACAYIRACARVCFSNLEYKTHTMNINRAIILFQSKLIVPVDSIDSDKFIPVVLFRISVTEGLQLLSVCVCVCVNVCVAKGVSVCLCVGKCMSVCLDVDVCERGVYVYVRVFRV